MSTDISAVPVIDNRDENRYELRLGEDVAVVDYRLVGKTILFWHTGVPDAFAGMGVGGRLAKFALDDAVARGLRIEAQCPFIAAYIKRHPEYQPHTRGYGDDSH